MNPLELPGPQFLAFFAITAVVAVVGAGVLRWALRQPAGDADLGRLSSCDVAYLAGGKPLAINAAITRLVHEKCLTLNAGVGTLALQGPLPADAEPLESALVAAVETHSLRTLTKLHDDAADETSAIQARLQEAGVLLSVSQARTAWLLPLTIVAATLLFGLAKLAIGIQRDKPIGFLIVLLFNLGIVAALFARRPFRSRRGDRLLARLRQDNAALQTSACRRPEHLHGSDLALALGLFGMGILTHESLAGLRERMAPTYRGDASGGCGDGGCGGGGCGGGGCGGGCGGCGG